MIVRASAIRIEPFFLSVARGTRFCLLHAPSAGASPLGGVLYVHPFAEEMNKSRRMAAAQARALASLGYAVLQIDFLGCGDSSGEFRDATLADWYADLDAAADWLAEHGHERITVWGLRCGALVAAQWASEAARAVESLWLWQPVTSGEVHLTQFLRISTAAEILAPGSAGGGKSLRARLAQGETLEVAGYDLTPTLAGQIDSLRLANVLPKTHSVEWFEVAATPDAIIAAGSRAVIEKWRECGIDVREHVVCGDAFWSTVEITDCPQLIDATSRMAREQWQKTSTSSR